VKKFPNFKGALEDFILLLPGFSLFFIILNKVTYVAENPDFRQRVGHVPKVQ